jgi:Ca2+/H+ antiporter, TMEM165/GDT1 family
MLYVFVVATILITLAELGDKTQLLALALATRYKAWEVLTGILVATLAVHFLSTLAGGLIGSLVPRFWLTIGSGVLFVGFGVWTLRGDEEPDADAQTAAARFGPVVTSGIAFFLAELGDKTQIMTMTIAANPAAVLHSLGSAGPAIDRALTSAGLGSVAVGGWQTFVAVWLGSTFGMMIADGIAIVVGAIMGKTLPERLLSRISGVLFIVVGLMTAASAFWS